MWSQMLALCGPLKLPVPGKLIKIQKRISNVFIAWPHTDIASHCMFLCRTQIHRQSCLQTEQRSCCGAVNKQYNTLDAFIWYFRFYDNDDKDRQSNVVTVAYSCLVFTNSISLMLRLCVYKYFLTLHFFATGMRPCGLCDLLETVSWILNEARNVIYQKHSCWCWNCVFTNVTTTHWFWDTKFCIASHSFEMMNVIYVMTA